MRLRYAAIAVLVIGVAGCWRDGLSAENAVNSAKSHMVGESALLSMTDGPLGELAPAGLEVTDPNQHVWAITLRGTFQIDCTQNAAFQLVDCPPEPRTGLLLLDYKDGSVIAISVISIIPPPEVEASEPASPTPSP